MIRMLCLAREHETFAVGLVCLESNGLAGAIVTDRNRLPRPWIHDSALHIAAWLDLDKVHASLIAGRGNLNASARLESAECHRGR